MDKQSLVYVGIQSFIFNTIFQPTKYNSQTQKIKQQWFVLTLSPSCVPYLAYAYFLAYQLVLINTISFLLLNGLCPLYAPISSFSIRHSRQHFVCGLYGTHVLTTSYLNFA